MRRVLPCRWHSGIYAYNTPVYDVFIRVACGERALQYQFVPHKLTIAVAAGDNRSSRDESRVPRFNILLSKARVSVYDEIYGVIRHTQRACDTLILNPILELACFSLPKMIIQPSKEFHSELRDIFVHYIWNYIHDNRSRKLGRFYITADLILSIEGKFPERTSVSLERAMLTSKFA